MTDDVVNIGDRVTESPVGPGTVTGFSDRGLPQVNNVTVAWLALDDGRVVDPFGKLDHLRRLAAPVPSQKV